MHPDVAADGQIDLWYFHNVHGRLHVLCTSYEPDTYCILKVYVGKEDGEHNIYSSQPLIYLD